MLVQIGISTRQIKRKFDIGRQYTNQINALYNKRYIEVVSETELEVLDLKTKQVQQVELGFRIPTEQSVPFQYLSGKLYFVLESKLYSISLTDMTCVFECNILPSKRIFALDRKNLAAEIDSGIIVYNVETCELSRLT